MWNVILERLSCLVGLWAGPNSSLCSFPPDIFMEGLQLLLMSPVLFEPIVMVSFHQPGFPLCLLYSSVPLTRPHIPPPSPSLYTVHHLKRRGCWALGGIKVIYEWASLPGCWRGKPVAVGLSDPAAHCSLQPHCRGSSSASAASDLLPCHWLCILPLSDSQPANTPMHYRVHIITRFFFFLRITCLL